MKKINDEKELWGLFRTLQRQFGSAKRWSDSGFEDQYANVENGILTFSYTTGLRGDQLDDSELEDGIRIDNKKQVEKFLRSKGYKFVLECSSPYCESLRLTFRDKEWLKKHQFRWANMKKQSGRMTRRRLESLGLQRKLEEQYGDDTVAYWEAFKKAFAEGKMTPASVVGGGLRNPKRVARDYIERQLAKARSREGEGKQAAVSPSGMYGYTKDLEKTVQASIRKIQKKARVVASRLYKADPSTSQFLATHAKRSKSASANILIEAMKDLGPKFAGKRGGYGMYGYRSKTAARSLAACSELKNFAGSVASDLHRRKAAKYAKVLGFLKEHHKTAGCNCSKMLMNYYPDKSMKFATEVDDKNLFHSALKLAHQKPKIRAKLLPLLRKQSAINETWLYWHDWED